MTFLGTVSATRQSSFSVILGMVMKIQEDMKELGDATEGGSPRQDLRGVVDVLVVGCVLVCCEVARKCQKLHVLAEFWN